MGEDWDYVLQFPDEIDASGFRPPATQEFTVKGLRAWEEEMRIPTWLRILSGDRAQKDLWGLYFAGRKRKIHLIKTDPDGTTWWGLAKIDRLLAFIEKAWFRLLYIVYRRLNAR